MHPLEPSYLLQIHPGVPSSACCLLPFAVVRGQLACLEVAADGAWSDPELGGCLGLGHVRHGRNDDRPSTNPGRKVDISYAKPGHLW
jgi:hypothetical protein